LNRAGVLALALCGGAALAQGQSDWERQQDERLRQLDEQAVPAPAYDARRWVPIEVAAAGDFRYYVDPETVSVGADRIVRYVVLARSAGGAQNIRFEGIRCPDEYRIYAVARSEDGAWSGRPTAWRAIPADPRSIQNTLRRHFFCPARRAIETAAEGRGAVLGGGHPAQAIGPR